MPLMSEMMRREEPSYETTVDDEPTHVFEDDDGNTYDFGDLPY